MRRISRANFPAAQAVNPRFRPRALATAGAAPRVASGPTGEIGAQPWLRLSTHWSSILNRPRVGPDSRTARYGVTLLQLLSTGRLDLDVEMGDDDGNLYLRQGRLQLDSNDGWRASLGDLEVPPGNAGLIGTRVRGVGLELATPATRQQASWQAGILAGRTALNWTNVTRGAYPRQLATGYVGLTQFHQLDLNAVVYHLADRHNPYDPLSPATIDHGAGWGFTAATRGARAAARAEMHGSRILLEDGTRQDGEMVNVQAQGALGPLSGSSRIRSKRGVANQIGSLGTLQQVPDLTQDVGLAYRAPLGFRADLRGGRWRYALDDSIVAAAESSSRAYRGDHWGGSLAWSRRSSGTSVSVSEDHRRRLHSSDERLIRTTAVALSQQLHRRVSASVRWNHVRNNRSPSYQYVTGRLSGRLARGTILSFQQRTVWQEPHGLRLETVADISSIRLCKDAAVLTGQLALTQTRSDEGTFEVEQVQGRIGIDLRLTNDLRLASSIQRNSSPGGSVYTLDGALDHAPGWAGARKPALGSTSQFEERQILHGRVFDDLNADGHWQSGEPGVPGVEVTIDGNRRDPVVTDLEGIYRSFVLPGRHVVRLAPASVPTDYALRGSGPIEIDVLPERTAEIDFGLARRLGTIEGKVIDDNRDAGLEGVKLYLNGTSFTFTDAQGMFRFRSLPAGTYEITLDAGSLPFGYQVQGDGTYQLQVTGSRSQSERCIIHVTRPVEQFRF